MRNKTRLIPLALALMLALSLAPGGTVAAQKATPEPLAVGVFPDPLNFGGLGSTQTLEVWVTEVSNFFGVEFMLQFNPSIIVVDSVVSGPELTGTPVVTIGSGTVTFANYRAGGPIAYADRLVLATITFRSVVPTSVLTAWGGLSYAKIVQPSGNCWYYGTGLPGTCTPATGSPPFPPFGTQGYQVFAAAGVQGQALWESSVTNNHGAIPVYVIGTGTSGADYTNVLGNYPALGPLPPMPAGGEVRINPMVLQRSPHLETRLTNCPASANLKPHTVTLVGGDVAPVVPNRTGDNRIDILDLVVCASNFGSPVNTNADLYMDGDANRDTLVDILDIVIIANNFGRTGPIIEPCP